MWHFTAADRILRYGDNREVVAGETLEVKPPIIPCVLGLHASERLIDALQYAPGPYVWFVLLSGQVQATGDKSVATRRRAVWGYDASEVLRTFARMVALEAVETYWDEKSLGKFPEVSLQYLKTGDESLISVAWSAARSVAWSAAESAAESAARSAAASAARSAAESAARSAAWSAAESAAASAARSAAWSAAASAAASAAWSAARSAQDKLLTDMILANRP